MGFGMRVQYVSVTSSTVGKGNVGTMTTAVWIL